MPPHAVRWTLLHRYKERSFKVDSKYIVQDIFDSTAHEINSFVDLNKTKITKYIVYSQSGLFYHYERLGVGHSLQIEYDNFNMLHNFLHYVNLDLTNILGYRNIINTVGVLTDFTCPEPGHLYIVYHFLWSKHSFKMKYILIS